MFIPCVEHIIWLTRTCAGADRGQADVGFSGLDDLGARKCRILLVCSLLSWVDCGVGLVPEGQQHEPKLSCLELPVVHTETLGVRMRNVVEETPSGFRFVYVKLFIRFERVVSRGLLHPTHCPVGETAMSKWKPLRQTYRHAYRHMCEMYASLFAGTGHRGFGAQTESGGRRRDDGGGLHPRQAAAVREERGWRPRLRPRGDVRPVRRHQCQGGRQHPR